MIFILEAHIAMLNSSSLVKDARKQIINKFVNSESAIISELKNMKMSSIKLRIITLKKDSMMSKMFVKDY